MHSLQVQHQCNVIYSLGRCHWHQMPTAASFFCFFQQIAVEAFVADSWRQLLGVLWDMLHTAVAVLCIIFVSL